MGLGYCNTCDGRPPVCDDCFDARLAAWSDSARKFGWRWGAGLRITLDRRGEVPKQWPGWDSAEAVNVRRICSRLVEPLAHNVPERRDPRLIAAFAKLCAAAAEEAYGTLTIDEARSLIADFDRRFPGWNDRLRKAAS